MVGILGRLLVRLFRQVGNVGKWVEKLATRLPDHIVAISEHTKESLIENGVKAKDITAISLGVNLAEIEAVKPAAVQSDLVLLGV